MVGLRHRARDDDTRRRQGDRERRRERRVAHVIAVRFVDQDARRGRGLLDLGDEVLDLLRAVDGRGRVVRVAQVDETRAFDERQECAQVGLQRLLGDRRRFDRVVEHVLRKACRIAVGRRRDDQMLGRRQEDARRVLQQLLRADAEHDVLTLPGVQPGDQDFQIGIERRAVERVAVGLGEGTERVFIAADADSFHSRREIRAHAAAALAALLQHRFCHELFVATGGHEGGSMRAPTHSQALKETAARHRHGIPPSATDYRRERQVKIRGRRDTRITDQFGESYVYGWKVSTNHRRARSRKVLSGHDLSRSVIERGSRFTVLGSRFAVPGARSVPLSDS